MRSSNDSVQFKGSGKWLGVAMRYVLPAVLACLGSLSAARVEHERAANEREGELRGMKEQREGELRVMKEQLRRMDVDGPQALQVFRGSVDARLAEIRDSQTEMRVDLRWVREAIAKGRR